MRVRALWSAVGVAAGLFAGQARAGVIYATGFEDPPFAAGSQLVGQDGWVGVGILSPAAATVTNTVARSGAQSVQVRGADLVGTGGVTDPYDAVGSYRRPVNFDAAAAGYPVVRVRADVRLDGPTVGSGDFASANVAARSGDGGVGELSVSSDGRVYAYTGNFGSPVLFSAPITLGEFHTLAVEVDFRNDRYSFFVDGTFLGQHAFEPGFTSDVLLRGSVVAYARPDGGTGRRADFTYRYDNFSVAARSVPEPASLGLVAAGGLGLVGYARRRGRGRT